MSTALRVLVVDDEMDCASMLTAILRASGCRTASSFGGGTCVRMAELFRPHLVLLDLEFPDTNGCQILKQIKQLDDVASQALFVCLTGSSTEDAEAKCREAGFDWFVRKPIHPGQLGEILDKAREAAERRGTLRPEEVTERAGVSPGLTTTASVQTQ